MMRQIRFVEIRYKLCAAALTIGSLAIPATAEAQWTVEILHPANATASRALAVRDGQQAGWAVIGGAENAFLWEGNAASGQNLHPVGATSSRLAGVSNRRQVGIIRQDFARRATLWQGTPESFLVLHPVEFEESTFAAVDREYAGGALLNFANPYPAFNVGTTQTWVNLLPGGRGTVHGVFENIQVGFSSVGYAAMWRSSPATFVNLHPTSLASRSQAFAVYGDQQVGSADLFTEVTVACLWRGTSASRVTLHQNANAYGVYAGQQVGEGLVNGQFRALRWVGSAPFATDLHLILPTGYSESEARSVWDDSELYTYVAGWARHSASGNEHAVLWKAPNITVANVESLNVFRGRIRGGRFSSILFSDDDRLVLGPGITFSSSEKPIQVVVESTAKIPSLRRISLSTEVRGTSSVIRQSVELFDFVSQTYAEVDSEALTVEDRVIRADTSFQASRYVEAGTGRIRARVSYWATGPVFAFPWEVGIDRMWFHMVGLE